MKLYNLLSVHVYTFSCLNKLQNNMVQYVSYFFDTQFSRVSNLKILELILSWIIWNFFYKSEFFSSNDCKEYCREEPMCQFWSLRKTTKKSTCFFHTSAEDRVVNPMLISGTRPCNSTSNSRLFSATADFTQSNLCGFKAPGLRGHRLENGDFIFSWQRGSWRMVLTDDQGNVKKWGAVQYGVATWQDPSTWITYDNRQYTVSNFKLSNQSCPECTEVVHSDTRYTGDDFKMVENISSYTDCKNLCTKFNECEVWTWDKKTRKQCKLKKKKMDIKSDKGIVSGTRGCFWDIWEWQW